MRRRTPCIEVLDEAVARALRRMTPAQRLALAFDAERFARRLVRASVRADHPRWSDARISREVARRFVLGAG
ncbi:MAG: hypothetical protein L0323_15810 [Planctomycetes bacterium]|nr:hypothetical protein [Planctomycetota bacterium]